MNLTTTVIDPKLITASDRLRLVEALYQTHNQIFDGVDKDEFTKYVIDSKANETQILLQKHQENIVGYGAIHFYKFDTIEERIAVVRMEVGFLPAYRRGNNHYHTFALAQIIKFLLKNTDRKLYFLGSLVHPSSYVSLTNLTKAVWPRYDQPAPSESIALIVSRLSEIFDFKHVQPSNPHVVKVGWKTREPAMTKLPEHELKTAAKFYIQQNPEYKEGNGLITIIPLNFKVLADVSVALFKRKRKLKMNQFKDSMRHRIADNRAVNLLRAS